MGCFARCLLLFLALIAHAPLPAEAESLTITAAYRERIALPPDAQLEVQLRDTRAGQAATVLASQRFAMTSVPMTVQLSYDPALILPQAHYAVTAELWSAETAVFRTIDAHQVFDDGSDGTVDLTLVMVPATDASPHSALVGRWTVTTLMDALWAAPQPGTLQVDDTGAVAIFAGCNRFIARPDIGPGSIAFPDAFPGTLVACPEALEQAERRLLDALSDVSDFVITGQAMTLTTPEGQVVMTLVRTTA